MEDNELERIKELERQIGDMQHELDGLKRKVDWELQNYTKQHGTKPYPVSAPFSAREKIQAAIPNPDYTKTEKITETPEQTAANRKNPGKDLEKRWGEYIMGIFASVLIFAGLILFVSLFYSHLTNTLKAITIFSVSTLLLLAGLFCRHRKNNAFAKSLTACGIGAFYISILVTYFRFGLLSQAGMYFLIALWLIGTAFLSKKLQSSSAVIIGQIGITFSVILGIFFTEYIGKIYFLLFFFLGTCLFYQMLFKNHTSPIVRLTLCILRLAACIGFVTGYGNAAFDYARYSGTASPFSAGAALLILYLYTLYILFLQDTKDLQSTGGQRTAYGIFQIFLLLCSLALVSGLLDIDIYSDIYSIDSWEMLLSIAVFWILTEWGNKITASRIVSASLCAVLFTGYLTGTGLFFEIFRTSLLWIPVLAYGFLRKEKAYQIIGIIFLAGNAFFLNSTYFLINAALLFAGVIVLLVFLYRKPELYRAEYKITAYLLSIGCLYSICSVILNEKLPGYHFSRNRFYISIIFYLVIACINLAALYSPFAKYWPDPERGKEKSCYIALRILNGILWILGMTYLHSSHINLPTQLFLILVTGILAFVGTKEWITKRKGQLLSGFYLGMKNTVFLWAVCASFEAFNDIMLSILFLVISILCILAGFRLAMKSFRIYGLILSMISVVKLLLFDFQYGNSIGRAAAFFIAGILCFIINFIYNYLNRENRL